MGSSYLLKNATPANRLAPMPDGARPCQGEARLRPCTAYSWTWPCAVNTGWNLNSTESS